MRILSIAWIAAAALAFSATRAEATVVNFDDILTNSLLVPDGYGGIDWGGDWRAYNAPQSPYNPSSGATRIYSTLAPDTRTDFSFSTPAIFQGAWFAGDTGVNPVRFEMYLAGALVGSSSMLDLSEIPTFLSSDYAGPVDNVVVVGPSGNFAMDDVTYEANVASVPEPSSFAFATLTLTGYGARCLRRRRSQLPG